MTPDGNTSETGGKPAERETQDSPQAAKAQESPQAREFVVSTSPHIRSRDSIARIMWTVSASLLPAVAWGVYVFGPRVLEVVGLGIASAMATEFACQAIRHKPITIGDGSAFLTGLLVALIFPVHIPWYVTVMGSVFGVGVAKHAFGGLGCNIWNPALAGRAFVVAAWTATTTVGVGWPLPFHHLNPAPRVAGGTSSFDAVTGATALTKVKRRIRAFNSGQRGLVPAPKSRLEAEESLKMLENDYEVATPICDLVLGQTPGSVGEVNAVALLLGGVVLVVLGIIKWQVPVFFIGTTALFTWLLPIPVQGEQARYYVWCAGHPLWEIYAGGLFLGAIYMATDMVTSPVTVKGRVIFAIGCGVITAVIRRYGGYPEGVCYAILLMNTATPLIDRYTKVKVFGRRRKRDD